MKTMHRVLRSFALTAALLILAAPSLSSALAQSQPAIVVGVVDFDLIMRESKAGKSLKGQFDKQREAFESEYQKQRDAFRDSEKKLMDQKASMAEGEFKKKVDELQAQGDKIEKSLTQRKRALETSLNKALGQVQKAALQIITEIAKKQSMTLVLNKSNIILSADAYDFTAEAMQKLDVKMPSVKLQ